MPAGDDDPPRPLGRFTIEFSHADGELQTLARLLLSPEPPEVGATITTLQTFGPVLHLFDPLSRQLHREPIGRDPAHPPPPLLGAIPARGRAPGGPHPAAGGPAAPASPRRTPAGPRAGRAPRRPRYSPHTPGVGHAARHTARWRARRRARPRRPR